MKNSFGNSLIITLFGESHQKEIGAVIDGLAPGLEINEEYIRHQLGLRRPKGTISTSRVEEDNFRIISGAYNNKTTGTPLTIIIENNNVNSKDYESTVNLLRPSHADFTANEKYHGFQDKRGGGHFSGRITAPIVAVGAIVKYALEKKGIKIGTHIKEIMNISDKSFESVNEIDIVNSKEFPVLDENSEKEMKRLTEQAAKEGNSVGGILETMISGIPSGVGEPWFDTLEGVISHGLFSIPGIKGVEFGAGFEICKKTGKDANDEFYTDGEKIMTKTNNSGGINGGISNGMPIILRTAVKPTPTIFIEQNTVNFQKMENTTILPEGRHDPCIAHRARVVQDSLVAISVADMLTVKFGTDYLR